MPRRRELARVGSELSHELGLAYPEPMPAQRIEGIYRQRIDLASGRVALIANVALKTRFRIRARTFFAESEVSGPIVTSEY